MMASKKSVITTVHTGYECLSCHANPIIGARFNCPQCKNYNLCENCEDNSAHDHPLLKIRTLQKK